MPIRFRDPAVNGIEVPDHVCYSGDPDEPPYLVPGGEMRDLVDFYHEKGHSVYRWLDGRITFYSYDDYDDYVDTLYGIRVRPTASEALKAITRQFHSSNDPFIKLVVYFEPVNPLDLVHQVLLDEAANKG